MVDYIVVGLGLAGLSFCETLKKNGKTFIVMSDDSQTSSKVAGGLYNPVILKRFTLSWRAPEQLKTANVFYSDLETRLGVDFNLELPVLRRFASTEEQNLWFEATDKTSLSPYLSTELLQNGNTKIKATLGFGKVLRTGRLNTKIVLESYKEWLLEHRLIKPGTFEYDRLNVEGEYLSYGDIKARNIVFAEGFGLKQNPYFNYLPLQGSKGEYLIVKSKGLKEKCAVKSSIFLIPLGNDLYQVGANYNSNDKTNVPTQLGRHQLESQLKDLINCDYEIVDQIAGVRPTVKDRRPLVGRHPVHKGFWVLNGFGSHGIMIAPWASKALYGYIENNEPLIAEMDVERFRSDWNT
ncbi:NAD(P)/FAD-dependent oxidoreductase [Maribacter sp. 2304DJ31-5]|uniref:NAD(P)/FAD-dependent oxidoreductase n=1 Tax=Maribacter sp. 2304DJ31-5 TaxID=3386273 RepID=UPI0039BCF9DF